MLLYNKQTVIMEVFEMKKVFLMLFTAISVFVSSPSFAGNCMHDNDRAADGSRCGGRSADSRPGGEGIR